MDEFEQLLISLESKYEEEDKKILTRYPYVAGDLARLVEFILDEYREKVIYNAPQTPNQQ